MVNCIIESAENGEFGLEQPEILWKRWDLRLILKEVWLRSLESRDIEVLIFYVQ